MNKVCWVSTHPIQYQAPLLKKIAEIDGVDLSVIFFSDFSTKNYTDVEFKQQIKWDVPLLEGYKYKFLGGSGDRISEIKTFSPWIKGLFSSLCSGNYDTVVVQGWNHYGMICAAIFAKLLRMRVFLRCEATDHVAGSVGIKRFIRELLVKFLLRLTDDVLYIGTNNKKFYMKRGVDPKKLKFMPYVVDNMAMANYSVQEANQLKSKYELNGKTVILYASKFISRKNPDLLVDSFLKMNNDSAVLIMVGNGELEADLKIRAKGKEKSIIFPGFINQKELKAYYAIADIFVLPSIDETWGLVINEAMCSGTAIISTRQVGAAIDLIDERNGRVIDKVSVETLTDALRMLVESGNLDAMKSRSVEVMKNWGIDDAVNGFSKAVNG